MGKRAKWVIRRLANGHCERCRRRCELWELAAHHLGPPYANGKPGDPHDKHDIRRENLVALCPECHSARPPHNMLYVDGQSVVANPLAIFAAISYTHS
jgi:5-methylcytosine-specific restriction endonuclease McrA